jgi:uncharacterized protein with ParB-like and HNH nuclease domain
MKTGASIEAKEYPLGKVFSSDYSFVIPNYQRPYSWKIDHVEALLDDISYFAFQDNQVEESKPYFLGSIVLIKKTERSNYEVIDGQQRLTTLTILLSTIREILHDSEAQKVLTDLIYDKESFITGTKANYRLQLRRKDQDFFNKYIQRENGLKEIPQEVILSDSQTNIRENTAYLLKRLQDEYTEQKIKTLAAYIVQKCFFVVVSTPDEESAFRIFSVLNDRGMQLSNADILKAEIIGEIQGAKEQDVYSQKWEDQEEEIGREDFNNLFAYIRMIHLKTKPKETILKEIRDYVKPKDKPKDFIDNELIPYIQAFQDIKNSSFASSTHAETVNQYLRWLNQLDNNDWVPPALSYIAKWRKKDTTKIVDFLILLERLAFGVQVMRFDINRRIEKYGKILDAIEKEDENPEILKISLSLTHEEKIKIINGLDGEVYNTQFCKYLLLRIDENLSDGSAHYNYPILSIEHVLPQNPKPDSEWMRLFPSEEERKSLTNRLGNLVLLSRRKNSIAQNYEFDKKKSTYFTSGGVAPLPLTTTVIRTEKWTPDEIISRQKTYIDMCIKIWNLST